jgi:putative cell wall-binding protein
MKISDYSSVTFITNSDRVLGTQGQDTKNFPVTLISDYVVGRLTTTNKITLSNSVDVSLTSGALPYSRITNVPTVSTSASGLMTVQLYNELVELINRNNKLILISGATASVNQNINNM